VSLDRTSSEEQGLPNISTKRLRAAEAASYAGPFQAPAVAISAQPPQAPVHHLARLAAAYAAPDPRRSALQLVSTVIPMVALWSAMVISVNDAYWITLLLSAPAAAFLVRLFMIQHACGHRSFFRSPRFNDFLGHTIGVLTLTQHGYWRKAHNIHHATSGNLDKRGIGDVRVLTVSEYLALPRWKRLAYRIYRHPIAFLGVGSLYLFVIKYRLPLDLLRRHREALASVMTTNVAIGGLMTGLGLWIGFADLLMVQTPIVVLSSLAGVWLFYVQHQFEHTYWRRNEDWNFHQAALYGSSYYCLPKMLGWFTANIGLHHVHHLCSRIPNYRLQDCVAEIPELGRIRRLTIFASLKCVWLVLWDEESQRMVSFPDLKKMSIAGQSEV
jgi:omega-6 fatty acid desaturase (delta-12 desaturase)